MILHRTHFKRARPWASGAGRNNANYEQQSFYQLNKLCQQYTRTSGQFIGLRLPNISMSALRSSRLICGVSRRFWPDV